MTHPTPPDNGSANRQNDTQLQQFPLNDLALFCAHELGVFAEGGTPDDRYPLELFRRAVALHDTAAWGCIYRQYASFVLSFLLRCPQGEALLDERGPAALVDTVLSTLSANLTEEKLTHLGSQAAILMYLRICVHSTIAELQRDQHLREHLAQVPEGTAPGLAAQAPIGEQQALWEMLVGEMHGEDERLLFTLLFVRGLSASAICSCEPTRFPDTETVYHVITQIFERLRTSEHLQTLLHLDQ